MVGNVKQNEMGNIMLENKYLDGRIVAYCGDCLDIMPTLEKVDLVLTDPPYGMDFQSNHRKEKHKKIENDISLEWIEDFFQKTGGML